MSKKKREVREAEKRRLDFLTRRHRLERRRNVVGVLWLVSVLFTFGCGAGTPFDLLCFIPANIWLFISAALLGSLLGLTIRLILERRRFQKVEREAA